VDVYIYASCSPEYHPEVSWYGRYIGHVESIGGRHPAGMKFRPPSTGNYPDDNKGYWAVFWEVEGLQELPVDKHILTNKFSGLNKPKTYEPGFVPEGPILITHP
jgi:hypothetical protein